jgi:hypothetical protein
VGEKSKISSTGRNTHFECPIKPSVLDSEGNGGTSLKINSGTQQLTMWFSGSTT